MNFNFYKQTPKSWRYNSSLSPEFCQPGEPRAYFPVWKPEGSRSEKNWCFILSLKAGENQRSLVTFNFYKYEICIFIYILILPLFLFSDEYFCTILIFVNIVPYKSFLILFSQLSIVIVFSMYMCLLVISISLGFLPTLSSFSFWGGIML